MSSSHKGPDHPNDIKKAWQGCLMDKTDIINAIRDISNNGDDGYKDLSENVALFHLI